VTPAAPPDGLPVLSFASAEAFEGWLAAHHASAPGLWLRIAKRGTGVASVSYPEALDVALCFGWIDGQKRAWDEGHWLQRFARRGPRSRWSQVNRGHVARLEAEGRMRPAGRAAVAAAKADGRWDAAYAGQRAAEVPEDLRAALAGRPTAEAAFAALRASERYSVLYRVQDAKRPETRARRIAQFVERLAETGRPLP
jgi:uncharacterized protein YdeI (YjbR/CyaY-like superfamily)